MSVPTEGPWDHGLYLRRNGTAESVYATDGALRPTSVKAALDLLKGRADQAYDTVNGLTATYETVDSGASASVTLTGPMGAKVLNFKIPRGPRGLSNDAAVQVAMSQQAGTAMRVGVQAGTVGLLVIADSKGAGTGLTNFADRWQNRLAALMRARFPITGGDTMRGLIPANMSDPYNAMSGRPTTTGTTYPVDTAGLGYNTLQLELGSVLTFPAATWPAASTLPIGYHTHSGANGTLQVLVDGVVQTEINCAGTGEGAPMRTSIPVAAGTHTVSMRPKAGTAPVRPMYIEQRSSTTGWHLYDAARPGLAARHVIDRPGAPQGGSSFAAAVAGLPSVRLAVVALGANDMTISAPAQYGSDLRAVVDMVKAGHPLTGVVVVLPAALTDDSAVVDDVSAYHTAARAALVDVPDLSVLAETQLVDLTGPNAGAWLADSVHPNAFGHDLISRALAGSLIGLDGPSDALTLVEAAAAPAVTAAQSAQTSAASSATDAAEARTLAQQAQAAKLEIPDNNVSALIRNPATQTTAALNTRLPSRQISVTAMPSWTGTPADDQTPAFIEAAASFTGAAQVLIPAGTWKVQGAPLREGLYWVGEGSGPTGTVLTLPDTVAAGTPMFAASTGGTIWAGGVASLKMVGNGAARGAGATTGVHGIDLFRFSQTHGFWVTDCHIERFDHGIRGAQNNSTTAVGDDRWLIIEGCLIWDNLIGIYANEHPQLAGNDVRRNDIGLTGRLYDLNLTDRNKFIRNRIGICGTDPVYGRGSAGSSSVISGAIFFRNDTAMILVNHCHVIGNFIEGGIYDPATGTDKQSNATRGIVVQGRYVSIVGNYFNPSASVEYATDILVDLADGARADLNVTGNSFRHAQPGYNVMKTNQRLTGMKFTANHLVLLGTTHGLLFNGLSTAGTLEDCHISDNTVYVEGGRVLQAGATEGCTIAGNHITVGGTGSRSLHVLWGGNSTTGSTWAGNRLYVRDGRTSTGPFIRASGANLILTDNSTPDPAGYPIQIATALSGQYRIAGNVGFKTEARGTVSMPAGTATVTITHGMVDSGTTGYYALVSPINGQGSVWVTGRTATGFTINRDTSTAAIVVAWYAAVYTEVS